MRCEDACDLSCAHDEEPVSQNWPAVQQLRWSTEVQAQGEECQPWPGPLPQAGSFPYRGGPRKVACTPTPQGLRDI